MTKEKLEEIIDDNIEDCFELSYVVEFDGERVEFRLKTEDKIKKVINQTDPDKITGIEVDEEQLKKVLQKIDKQL